MPFRIRGLPGLVLAAVVLLLVVPSAVAYYTDWLWFRELGYEAVFLRTINAQLIVFVVTFTAIFLFIFLNLHVARRTLDRPQIVLGTGLDGRTIALEGRRLAGVAVWGAAIIALVLGLAAASNWLTWLSFFNGMSFGDRDPLFGRDVAFYVFRLPVWQLVRQQAMATAVLTLIGCGLYYVLSGSFVIETGARATIWPSIRLVTRARQHLGLLLAVVFILMAWGAWLELPDLLLTPGAAVVFGVSYVDWHAGVPFIWASLVILAIGAVLALVYGFGRKAWPLAVAIGLYVGVSFIGGVYGAILQRFVVTPNEQTREQPFIVHNIAATRRAYGLDRVETREVSGDAELTPKDIINNAETVENVRLWDHGPLRQTFSQIQEIRTYYDFDSVDNDRYVINGKYRQVMLSARELNSESIQNRSWVNERLTFTHGYGLTLGPVNEVTTEGQPVLFIRDLPPVSDYLPVTEPSIYFGEISSGYVLVRTKQLEFHYPKGDDNETTYYQGAGGIPIGSFLRRLLFAIRFANTSILVTDLITPESRIMMHRRISERTRLIAPFLTFDTDPYLVVSGGRLFWIQDAYTTTRNYPYSTPYTGQNGSYNYIRNSVKVVVDAYNGTTTYFLAEPDDPMARTIAKIFPGLLRPMSEMSEDLRKHVRYPEDIFKAQTQIYQSYHMTNPLVFYNKEDQWQVPVLDSDRNPTPMQPYYTIMRLPGESRAEFLQMLPFTPRLKDNLAAWMVARSDADRYGRMLVFQFPKQKIIFGPRQVVGRINQDEVISQQITLWNQQGSEVIWGTLLVIPVNESLLYVRPLYLRSSEGRMPELKRVIVAYQSRIVMADTMNLALAEIFGRSITAALSPDRLETKTTSVVPVAPTTPLVPTPPQPAALGTLAELAAQAQSHYDRMTKAQRDGDWALYGEELKKLGAVLEKMRSLKKE